MLLKSTRLIKIRLESAAAIIINQSVNLFVSGNETHIARFISMKVTRNISTEFRRKTCSALLATCK